MKNYGKYFELLIKKTFSFINSEKKGYFFKFDLPIVNLANNQKISRGSKGNLDYYGIINGAFVAIEAKSVSKHNYLTKQNFTKGQIIKINDFIDLKAQVYIFVYFVSFETFIVIKAQEIIRLFKDSPRITMDQLLEIGHTSEIIYPGILDISFLF